MHHLAHSGEAVIARPRQSDAMRHGVRALFILAVVFTFAWPTYLLTASRKRIVQYVSDDAYYYFSVAAHIATGDGPTADGVTVTTGFHPLYCFLLAGVHYLTDPSLDGFVREAIALNALSFIVAGVILGKAVSALCNRQAGWATMLLWWTNPHGLLISSVGLEGSLYSLTLALLFWRTALLVARKQESIGFGSILALSAVIGVCGGLTVLSRTDSLLFIPAVGLIVLLLPGRIRFTYRAYGAISVILIPAAFLSLWWWYAWKHTGMYVQGSAAVKAAWREYLSAQHSELMNLAYGARDYLEYLAKCALKVPALKWCIPILPVVLSFRRGECSGARRAFLHTLWVVPVVLGIAYVTLIDRPRTWYYVPAIAGLTVICAVSFHRLTAYRVTHPLRARLKAALPIVVWLLVVESTAIFVRNGVSGRSKEQKRAVTYTQQIDLMLEQGVIMGCWHSGIMQYYTPRHTVINLDGLANNEILRVLNGEITMNQYWDERGITVILGQPREKMGSYKKQWNGKKLEQLAPGAQRVVPDDRH